MIANHGLQPFYKWTISEEGTEGRSGEILSIPNPQTKIAECPIVITVILDFAIIVQMLPPKTAHL